MLPPPSTTVAPLAGDQPPGPRDARHGRHRALLPRRARHARRGLARERADAPLLLRDRRQNTVAFFEWDGPDVDPKRRRSRPASRRRSRPSSTTSRSTCPTSRPSTCRRSAASVRRRGHRDRRPRLHAVGLLHRPQRHRPRGQLLGRRPDRSRRHLRRPGRPVHRHRPGAGHGELAAAGELDWTPATRASSTPAPTRPELDR